MVAPLIGLVLGGRRFQRPVHVLDLVLGVGMVGLRQMMFDAVFAATHIKHMPHISRRQLSAVLGQIGALNAVVGKHPMELVADRLDQSLPAGSMLLADKGYDSEASV